MTPGQQVVKIVHDALVEMLGSTEATLDLDVVPPAVFMLVGLQGSGKTTTTAKLAKRLTEKDRKKVLMASLDVARPADRSNCGPRPPGNVPPCRSFRPVAGEIARRAINAAGFRL